MGFRSVLNILASAVAFLGMILLAPVWVWGAESFETSSIDPFAMDGNDPFAMARQPCDIKGFIRGEAHVPAFAGADSKNSFGSPDTYFVLTGSLSADASFTDNFSAGTVLRYRIKDLGRSVDPDSYVGNHATESFDLREAWVKYRSDSWSVTAGQQIFAWGTTDGFNPSNAVFPQDRTFVSSDRDDKRLGVPAVKGELFWGALRLTGIFQPVFVDSRFRVSGLPENTNVTIKDVDLPDRKLSNSTLALKCSISVLSTDLSFFYTYGRDPDPDIVLDGVTASAKGITVGVVPVFNRLQTVGFDFDSLAGPFLLRGEAVYRHVDPAGKGSAGRRKSEIQWILGPEWTWFEDLTINIQYGMTHVMGYETVTDDPAVLNAAPQAAIDFFNARMYRQLNRTNPMATMRMDWQMRQETLLLQFRGLYYIDDREIRLKPRAVYDINDRFKITLAADFAFGPSGSRFDNAGKNYNEVFSELKYSF